MPKVLHRTEILLHSNAASKVGRNALRHVSLPAQAIDWSVGVSKRGDVKMGHEG